MPNMPSNDVIAIAIADIHLTLHAPACRAEDDWLKVQAGYLQQVRDAARELEVPVLCAGDIFDRWNAQPELIAFALRTLPHKMVCVPGQHDLPDHQLSAMGRSGYGVLLEAGTIFDLSTKVDVWPDGDFYVQGAGWGQDIPAPAIADGRLKILLVHRYVWASGKCYPGAPETQHINAFKKQLEGWDVVIFGDNHKSFSGTVGDTTVVNCGGFMRRKSDEVDSQPSYWEIRRDGTVRRVRLDVSKDEFHKDAVLEPQEVGVDVASFVSHLKGLGEQGMDFRAAVKHHFATDEVSKPVQEIMLKALEHDNRD